MLKYKLDADSFGKLDEPLQALYKQDGSDYVLQAEGVVPKSKLDEFRQNNIELTKKLEGVDLDEYNRLKTEHQAIQDKKLIEAGDVDQLVANKVQAIQSDLTGKLENIQNQYKELESKYTQDQKKWNITDVAHKAMAEHKIRPESHDLLMKSIEATFTLKDGAVVAMDGDKIKAGANGNLTVSEFVASQPDFLKIQSTGGHGQGGSGGSANQPTRSVDKIKVGLEARKG